MGRLPLHVHRPQILSAVKLDPAVVPLGTANELGIIKPTSGLFPSFAPQSWVVERLLFVIFCWVRI